MNKDEFVFVYGTLLSGERASLREGRLRYDADYIGPDEINGKLYYLGTYPGLKLINCNDFQSNQPRVVGEVYLLKNSAIGAVLDAYEGYHLEAPEKGLYNRCQVLTRRGRCVWTYTYNHPVTEDQLIETGDWKNPRLSLTRKLPNYSFKR